MAAEYTSSSGAEYGTQAQSDYGVSNGQYPAATTSYTTTDTSSYSAYGYGTSSDPYGATYSTNSAYGASTGWFRKYIWIISGKIFFSEIANVPQTLSTLAVRLTSHNVLCS